MNTGLFPPEKELPPPYVEASTSDTPALASQIILSGAPCNFLVIKKTYEGIKGSWKVDTSLHISPSVLAPLEEGETERYNLDLSSSHKRVTADVELVGGIERADIRVKSYYHSVILRLTNPANQRVNIVASSHNGTVTVLLPRSFRGPIFAKAQRRSISFSLAMLSNIVTFSETNGVKKCFLGAYKRGSDFGKEGMSWDGDQVENESANNNMNFCYMDEHIPSSEHGAVGAGTSSKSILGRWFQ